MTFTITFPKAPEINSVTELNAEREFLDAVERWIKSKPVREKRRDLLVSPAQANVQSSSSRGNGAEPTKKNAPPAIPPVGQRGIDFIVRVLQAEASQGNRDGLSYAELLDKLNAMSWPLASKNPKSAVRRILSNPSYSDLIEVVDGVVRLTEAGMIHLISAE